MIKRLVSSLCFLLLLGGVASAAVVGSFRTGSWNGNAFTNDQTGAFDSCVAIAKYRSGISMSVQVDANYSWWIGFSAPGWTMTTGEKIALQYRIDRGPWQQGTAEAISPELARMAMPQGGYIITRFRRGRTLYVYDGTYNYQFRLTGTSRLMRRMARCVDTYAARYGTGAPVVGSVAPGSAADSGASASATPEPEPEEPPHAGNSDDPQLKIEAAQSLFNLMGRTGALTLQLQAEDQRTDDLKGYHAVAYSDARTMTSHIRTAGSYASEQALLTDLISISAKGCEGDFSSGTGRKTVGDKTLFTGHATCVAGDFELAQRYAIAPRGKGGVYMFSVADSYVGEGGGAPVSPPSEITADAFNQAAAAAAQ
ncbi:hypothetical protein [Coralliovum pocilloporae]|uniref:hypothetical protein n=1 Tax=Coralliovum pocilloporae TaxID=3066369 RepID=UPI003306B413